MRVVLAIVFFIDALQFAYAQSPPQIDVLDADTVRQAGVTWRIVGLDSPEIQHARCASERHAGIIAAAHLLAVLGERGGS